MKNIRWAILAALSTQIFGTSAFAGKGPPTEGLFNNEKTAPLASLIDGAQESVAMEVYEMDDPAIFAALRSALQRGVSVQIVQDPTPVGSACRVFGSTSNPDNGQNDGQEGDQPHHSANATSCADQQKFVSEVNASKNGKYAPFRKDVMCPNGKGCYEHGKLAIIDDTLAMISSGNFNVSNLCDQAAKPAQCDRDYSFVTRDSDVVDALSKIVASDIAGTRYDLGSLLPPQVAAKITVGPQSRDSLLSFIESAQSSIEIENQYLKDATLNNALMAAAKRGVQVKVMLASGCEFGAPKPTEVKKLTEIFAAFDSAGISTRIFTKNVKVGGFDGYLHAKAIVVDGTKAWMGSVNGSTTALTKNREFGIYFDDSTDVSSLDSIFSSDFANTGAESWQDSLTCAENHK